MSLAEMLAIGAPAVALNAALRMARSWSARVNASALAVSISLRIESEMAELTKVTTENGRSSKHNTTATQVYARTTTRACRGSAHARRLCAVTGLTCSAM